MTNKAYKIRLYPTSKQAMQINTTLGCCRFVYNKFLYVRKEGYKQYGESFGGYACSYMLTEMKRQEEVSFLNKADASALNYALNHLDAAYKNFFRTGAGYPQFKKKKTGKQTYTTQKCYIRETNGETTISLPKIGKIKYSHGYEGIEGRVVSATVTKRGYGKKSKYYLSVCCDVKQIKQLPKTGKQVGFDLGIKTLVTTSDGKKLGKDKYYKRTNKLNKQLKRLQRCLARKTRGSENRDKLLSKLNFLYERISDRKQDKLHKLTKRLVTDFDVICVEDLAINNMFKNKHLAPKLQQLGLSEILRQLDYKCKWYGKQLVVIDRWFASSQLCSACGHQNKKVKNLAVRHWKCPDCGKDHNRDVNAARNILKEGLRQLTS